MSYCIAQTFFIMVNHGILAWSRTVSPMTDSLLSLNLRATSFAGNVHILILKSLSLLAKTISS